jgi:Xaa-Pro aminopeptidase
MHNFISYSGLYIPESRQDVPRDFRGIGIRIEDDVLISSSGPVVLTAKCPKSPADIEHIMKGD